MYTQYFGLKENPFALSPDPRYLYLSQRHQDGLAHLTYGITGGGGFVQLTGEVGTGKTLLIRALLQRLPETVDVALVLYPFLSVREFMIALCDDLRIPRPAENSLKALIDTLNGFLLDNHASGRRTVLIVDEAHRLNREVLEQIRLLTNLETTKEKLLQIVLVGQPELNSLLAQPEMRQLAQRITARYSLQPLLPRDTRAYVLHRCRVAGAQAPLFSSIALWWVHHLTGGVPRLVNLLCDRALLAAYAAGKTRVSARLVRSAAREVKPGIQKTSRQRVIAGVVSALLLVGLSGAAAWRFAPQWLPNLLPHGESSTAAATATAPPTTSAPEPVTASAAAKPNAGNPMQPVATGLVTPTAPPAASAPDDQAQPTLEKLLADPSIPTDTDTAFSGLFAQWGIDYAQYTGSTGCERAQKAGLRCVFDSGTWNNIRQLNRPAIIELIDPSGLRHHVLVSHLEGNQVTLEFPGKQFRYSLGEVDRFWFGKYLALWNPPAIGDRAIRRGMRGAPVAWVRSVLQRYGLGQGSTGANDFFDAGLEAQVKEFQRAHQLQDDGIVGKQTLIYLSTFDTSASSPLLDGANASASR
jgi:general secretion pathway protein A